MRQAQIAERKLRTETPSQKALRLKQEEAAERKSKAGPDPTTVREQGGAKVFAVGDSVEAEFEVRPEVGEARGSPFCSGCELTLHVRPVDHRRH